MTAGRTFLEAAEGSPDEVRGAGIVPADLEGLRSALAALTGVDDDQERKKLEAVLSTAERNATAVRLEEAVARIGAAGLLVAGADPARRARYEALLSKPKRARSPSPS